jgi:hypothetical protein
MAGRSDEAGRGSFLCELFLNGFIAASDAENHVHFRARAFFTGQELKSPLDWIAS